MQETHLHNCCECQSLVNWTPPESEIHSICDLLIHINIYEHLLRTYVCMQHTCFEWGCWSWHVLWEQKPAEESLNAHKEETVKGMIVHPDHGMTTCVIGNNEAGLPVLLGTFSQMPYWAHCDTVPCESRWACVIKDFREGDTRDCQYCFWGEGYWGCKPTCVYIYTLLFFLNMFSVFNYYIYWL